MFEKLKKNTQNNDKKFCLRFFCCLSFWKYHILPNTLNSILYENNTPTRKNVEKKPHERRKRQKIINIRDK